MQADSIMASNDVESQEKELKLDSKSKDFVSENYIIVDIGANLTNKKFSRDLDSVVVRAQDAGQFKANSILS